jgi:RHS repeat-associated protein
MTQVEEPNPTLWAPLVTTYTYNVLDKLIQSNQAGQIRTWVYDALGRLASQTLPESGTTTFTYNAEGLPAAKTDSRNITTTTSYGTSGSAIHQVVTRSYSDATPAVSFNYNPQGLRSWMFDGLGGTNYAYDLNTDKLTQESRSLTGVTGIFTTAYSYNLKGDLIAMTYPSGRVVNLNYATGGGCCNSRLASVSSTAAAPGSPSASVSGTGGTITTSGGYTIHTFTTSGTFTVTAGGNVEVLAAGGGGGGGHNRGGGGGAGGVVYNSTFPVTAQPYAVTIGNGGAGGVAGGDATGGGASTFSSLTALGGGHGASADASAIYGSGGSGGGAAGDDLPTNFGNGTPGQGNHGGGGANSAGNRGGGGGGGAGAVGENGAPSKGGNGGAGLAFSISGASVIYGGGGGAGILAGDTPGSGGTGGGGAGTSQSSGQNGGNGAPNTGGGGGGSGYAVQGGNGGSGIVIIRYPTPSLPPPPTTTTTINSAISYNAAGELTASTLGNGVAQTYAYNSRLQMTGITASVSGTSLMNFTYDYGTSSINTGRVLARTDNLQPEHSAAYSYDSIYRLNQVTSSDNVWGIGWSFDVWGNRLTQTPTGFAPSKIGTQSSGYTNNRNNANTYDLAGNQTNDGLHNYAFNAENQITQMDGGAAVYAYDGEGKRMKKVTSTETTYTFYGPGGIISEFTTSNAIATATAASSTDKCFYHTTDKLGSAALVMTANGVVIENNRTLPYGETWLSSENGQPTTNDKKFTTYQRDSESNLDYAMNRYNSNTNGRFMSADQGRMVLFRPATLNRYLYTADDPINDTDADGSTAASVIRQLTCGLVLNFGSSLRGLSPGTLLPGCPSPPEPELEGEMVEGISGQDVNNAVREGRGLLGSAAALAQQALGLESCNKHFTGTNAAEKLGELSKTIGFRFTGPAGSAETRILGKGSDGKGTTAQILINVRTLPTPLLASGNTWMQTDDIGRATILIHELGHVYNGLRGLSSDLNHAPGDEQGNFDVSNTILKDCFGVGPRYPEEKW